MKFALLLCTYNEPSRCKMYEDVIDWWIEKKEFDIYAIDSFNNVFSNKIESNVKTLHFDQNPFSNSKNQTDLELISLNEAYNVFGTEWENKYDYIIKLTAKYKLPELTYTFLTSHVKLVDYDIVCQYKIQEYGNKDWQNTELVLFNTKKMKYVIDTLTKLKHKGDLEKRIWYFSRDSKYISLTKLSNISKYKRRIGDCLTFL